MNDTLPSRSADAPPLETIHSVLKNRRRRFVVDVLARRQAPIDLRVLARAIAMRLPSEDANVADAEEAASDSAADLDWMAAALHHVDLPKLAQADVVEYDPEAKVVTPSGADRLMPYLDGDDSLR